MQNACWPEGWLIGSRKNSEYLATEEGIRRALEKQIVLEARAAVCDSNHNLWVQIPCMKGMIPREEGALGIADGSVRDIALIARVGKPVCFVVKQISSTKDGAPIALLSRREVQEDCLASFAGQLVPGDVIPAVVTHLEPFGTFCDIGCGISSLIPIDCISVSRISHPRDRFSVGESIRVIVRSLENGRINLSHKELLGTWEENAARFSEGETVPGIIRTVENYGDFVELLPNLAGLAEPREGTRPGQQVSVFIKSIIPEKMKIKLIIIDAFEDDLASSPPDYFFTGDHMDFWRYSPEHCLKEISVSFSPGTM